MAKVTSSSDSIVPPEKPKNTPSTEDKKAFQSQGSYRTVLGMNMTKKEYYSFLNNEAKMIMQCAKRDEAHAKKAQEEIKKSIEGQPL